MLASKKKRAETGNQMSFAEAGVTPLFAAQWAWTEIDGVRGADPSELYAGAEWSWHGTAIRLDLGSDPGRGPLRLEDAIGSADLRRVAARRAGRFGSRVRRAAPSVLLAAPPPAPPLLVSDYTAFRRSFTVTDGRQAWAVAPAVAPDGGPDLILFSGEAPPASTPLWVVTVSDADARVTDGPTALAGFSIGSAVETPFGPQRAELLRPGDPVLTDRGSSPLRRVRLRPGVAALRLEPGVLGEAGPPHAVTLGAGTLVAVEGRRLSALFGAGDGSPDVLEEALVRASDLTALPGVTSVRSADLIAFEVDCHVDGAALVMAGGLACLAGPDARAGLRCLTRAEAQVALAPEGTAAPTWRALRARAA